MTTQEITRMIEDGSVTDDAVFNALRDDYLADKYDAEGKIIPPSPEDMRDMEIVREKIISQRPAVFQRFHDYVAEMHRHCCGPEADST